MSGKNKDNAKEIEFVDVYGGPGYYEQPSGDPYPQSHAKKDEPEPASPKKAEKPGFFARLGFGKRCSVCGGKLGRRTAVCPVCGATVGKKSK